MSLFIPSCLESNTHIEKTILKRVYLTPMFELESGHVVSILLDDEMIKPYEITLPRITRN